MYLCFCNDAAIIDILHPKYYLLSQQVLGEGHKYLNFYLLSAAGDKLFIIVINLYIAFSN